MNSPLTIKTKSNKVVPITYEPQITNDNIRNCIETQMFKDWIKNFDDKNLKLNTIHFQNLDLFGERIGFIKFKAHVERDGKQIPGIIFMRGGSVAILTIIVNKGVEYALCLYQARVPIGKIFLEIPAGMLDGSGNFSGIAAKELEEETGIKINSSELIDLFALTYGDKCSHQGMYPSPGACDEFIRLFAFRTEMADDKFAVLEGKFSGLIEEGEIINLHIVPLDDLWKETPDGKTLAAYCLYDKLKRAGTLNPYLKKYDSDQKQPDANAKKQPGTE